jgi:hypothetical protein
MDTMAKELETAKKVIAYRKELRLVSEREVIGLDCSFGRFTEAADPSPLTIVKDLRDIDWTNLREVGAFVHTGELSNHRSSQR